VNWTVRRRLRARVARVGEMRIERVDIDIVADLLLSAPVEQGDFMRLYYKRKDLEERKRKCMLSWMRGKSSEVRRDKVECGVESEIKRLIPSSKQTKVGDLFTRTLLRTITNMQSELSTNLVSSPTYNHPLDPGSAGRKPKETCTASSASSQSIRHKPSSCARVPVFDNVLSTRPAHAQLRLQEQHSQAPQLWKRQFQEQHLQALR
jgi:hypothetical protein